MRLEAVFLLAVTCWCDDRPNIVLFLVDDLGYGDVPCFGNRSVQLPHLAQLCGESAQLTHHLAAAVLCSPSRAAFLTGRYARRSGLAGAPGSPPVLIYSSGRVGLPRNETTFGEVMKSAGYTTGLVGKWHLGLNRHVWGDMEHGPLGQGFDYFFGLVHTLVDGFELEQETFFSARHALNQGTFYAALLCLLPFKLFMKRRSFLLLTLVVLLPTWFLLQHFRLTTAAWWQRSLYMEKMLNSFLMENNEVVEKPVVLEELSSKLTSRSLAFIERAVRQQQPFLLLHSFTHVHTPLATRRHVGRSGAGPYGDVLLEMDEGVGQILNRIKQLGLEQNTLVYFSSDHGAHVELGQLGGSNGPFRGGKSNAALEGGIRVPGFVKWPGHVVPGSQVDQPTSLLDMLPTLAEVGGVDVSHLRLDGESLLPHLVVAASNKSRSSLVDGRTLFHHCNSDIFAIRTVYGGVVYKMVVKEPVLESSGLCPGEYCPCHGHNIKRHEVPPIFAIDSDPTERNPISQSSPLYWTLSKLMMDSLLEFQSEMEATSPPSQLNSWLVMPTPWLQPIRSVKWAGPVDK